MILKLSMLTAVAVFAMPAATGAQASYGSNSAPKAQQTQSDADDGLTPAERASKKTARSKAKTPSDVTAQDAQATTLAPATAAPRNSTPAPTTATPQSNAPGQTGTTPGQAQTSPGAASQLTPAQTGQTPSGQAVPNPSAGQAQVATDDTQGGGAAKPAMAADVKAGVSVYDSKGVVIGKIESVSGKNAVLSSGGTKASIPISSFAKNGKGLLIGMTKSEFEAATKKQ